MHLFFQALVFPGNKDSRQISGLCNAQCFRGHCEELVTSMLQSITVVVLIQDYTSNNFGELNYFTPDSAKSKVVKFSKITNMVKLKNKQHQS